MEQDQKATRSERPNYLAFSEDQYQNLLATIRQHPRFREVHNDASHVSPFGYFTIDIVCLEDDFHWELTVCRLDVIISSEKIKANSKNGLTINW